MPFPIGREAEIPNPKLQAFGILLGEWTTIGTHPLVPNVTLHGRVCFEWIESGAFQDGTTCERDLDLTYNRVK